MNYLTKTIQGYIKPNQTIKQQLNLISKGLEPKPTIKTGREIGIDRGVKKLFATSEGEEQLIKLQRELSRKKQGSKNYQEKKLELARKHEKISNRMKDRNHKLSRKLVNKFDLIGLEDLKTQFLSYKVKETGKEVIVVNPKNTTQRCSQCGKLTNPKIERDVEIYNCFCGLILDRDVNAAKNILYLAQNNRLGTLPTELV
ncbi:7713_t:CDS:2 [Cetraspora pellucida]|uniref:7713_t:CDS:1 n=1 Tax=Cetraspora pellucida TaxID=1433469 RepID=A0ACA9K3M3_9GLOM|nr:7713_t:CDS:2 [Cetraspora pellucida]